MASFTDKSYRFTPVNDSFKCTQFPPIFLQAAPPTNSKDMADPIVLIDASGWLFRAYHALPPLTSSKGEATGAIYGMINMISRLMRDHAPTRIAVVFDAPGKTFRDELYADYKANRDATPDDLIAQIPAIHKVVQAMGLPILHVAGVEADDVIGTLARQGDASGCDVLIVTSDKDMAQLVNARISLLDTMKNRRLDPAGVDEKFGVPPGCIIDYLALIGDTSDNIPGVTLVGPKTAAKWLKSYGSLDGIVDNAAQFAGKTGENLRASIASGQLALSRQLATIDCTLSLPVSIDELTPAAPDPAALAALYAHYEFNRLLSELTGGPQSASAPTAPPASVLGSDPVTAAPPVDGLIVDADALATPTIATTILSDEDLSAMLAALESTQPYLR